MVAYIPTQFATERMDALDGAESPEDTAFECCDIPKFPDRITELRTRCTNLYLKLQRGYGS